MSNKEPKKGEEPEKLDFAAGEITAEREPLDPEVEAGIAKVHKEIPNIKSFYKAQEVLAQINFLFDQTKNHPDIHSHLKDLESKLRSAAEPFFLEEFRRSATTLSGNVDASESVISAGSLYGAVEFIDTSRQLYGDLEPLDALEDLVREKSSGVIQNEMSRIRSTFSFPGMIEPYDVSTGKRDFDRIVKLSRDARIGLSPGDTSDLEQLSELIDTKVRATLEVDLNEAIMTLGEVTIDDLEEIKRALQGGLGFSKDYVLQKPRSTLSRAQEYASSNPSVELIEQITQLKEVFDRVARYVFLKLEIPRAMIYLRQNIEKKDTSSSSLGIVTSSIKKAREFGISDDELRPFEEELEALTVDVYEIILDNAIRTLQSLMRSPDYGLDEVGDYIYKYVDILESAGYDQSRIERYRKTLDEMEVGYAVKRVKKYVTSLLDFNPKGDDSFMVGAMVSSVDKTYRSLDEAEKICGAFITDEQITSWREAVAEKEITLNMVYARETVGEAEKGLTYIKTARQAIEKAKDVVDSEKDVAIRNGYVHELDALLEKLGGKETVYWENEVADALELVKKTPLTEAVVWVYLMKIREAELHGIAQDVLKDNLGEAFKVSLSSRSYQKVHALLESEASRLNIVMSQPLMEAVVPANFLNIEYVSEQDIATISENITFLLSVVEHDNEMYPLLQKVQHALENIKTEDRRYDATTLQASSDVISECIQTIWETKQFTGTPEALEDLLERTERGEVEPEQSYGAILSREMRATERLRNEIYLLADTLDVRPKISKRVEAASKGIADVRNSLESIIADPASYLTKRDRQMRGGAALFTALYLSDQRDNIFDRLERAVETVENRKTEIEVPDISKGTLGAVRATSQILRAVSEGIRLNNYRNEPVVEKLALDSFVFDYNISEYLKDQNANTKVLEVVGLVNRTQTTGDEETLDAVHEATFRWRQGVDSEAQQELWGQAQRLADGLLDSFSESIAKRFLRDGGLIPINDVLREYYVQRTSEAAVHGKESIKSAIGSLDGMYYDLSREREKLARVYFTLEKYFDIDGPEGKALSASIKKIDEHGAQLLRIIEAYSDEYNKRRSLRDPEPLSNHTRPKSQDDDYIRRISANDVHRALKERRDDEEWWTELY